ncbi:ArsR/SmtB family transcription factor [Phytoactinopolyspora limicola]|uniref:ArsR/SmtB family transcription factor n=1 Tax=Phytoactinopolyspora limicola TaxID=2715536 RepID=UPI00140C2195|nr:DUF5937 family protein [Phytoactinopolyspora limicola]
MLELAFTPQDLAATRLAFSPLWEAVASVRTLQRPAAHALHLPWVTRTQRRLATSLTDVQPFTSLVPPHPHHLPGFLAPTPTTPTPDLASELAALRDTPAAKVRSSIEALRRVHPEPHNIPLADQLTDHPATGLATLSSAIETYWTLAIEPDWTRISSLLEGDVLYRARAMADGGAQRLLNELDPAIRWEDDVLTVAHPLVSDARRLEGRGLVLVPSVFVWPRVASKTSQPWQPVLRYPARGVATLWEQGTPAPEALRAVVGRSRARLLVELSAPASTADLARRTALTPGGVSQHLTVMRDAGLVVSHRVGRVVLYMRTALGDALAG